VREATVTAACGHKALRELGYEPEVGFREGLRLQVEAALTRPAVAA
jgi:nucleoside-diphosphate-sugar epimerase